MTEDWPPESGGPGRPEVVLLVGLQAAGKSTFYRQRYGATHALVSRDLFRNNRRPSRRQQQLIEDALRGGRSVVVDNTSPTVADRAAVVAVARALGARITCCFFPPDPPASIARNASRQGKERVPVAAILATASRLVAPSAAEGLDDLFEVEAREGGFEVRRSWPLIWPHAARVDVTVPCQDPPMAHPLAGKPAPRSMLVDVPRLLDAYAAERPDPGNPLERVAFGTSGHRGSSLRRSFNEAHILAVTQATCEHRASQGITGPLFLGKDTHALSGPAQRTALEVLAANGVEVFVAEGDAPTPTPVISHAILVHNRGRTSGLSDGIVITPSHNPPEDGGIKYNPPNGGPADTAVTGWIEARANALLAAGGTGVKRVPYEAALRAPTTHARDYVAPYVADLGSIVDLAAVKRAGLKLGVDPLGGSNVGYWEPIARAYGLSLEVVNPAVDPTFGFMTLDHDGKIRMDCSSPYAMAGLVGLKDRFDLAFGNDADSDRHGIVTPSSGLMNPNHYLAVAIGWLFGTRRGWAATAGVGKTLVSSALIDRVARKLGRRLVEVPVGFKWFVDGLLDGSIGFGGEESAGASFLRMDGTVWSTDKDGIIMDLLAAEIRAVSGRDPGRHYEDLARELGRPVYTRIDAPATPAQKSALKRLAPEAVKADLLAGEPIVAKLTRAPGNGAEIGGLKVVAENGWFAARPSGTEDVYKVYAESFRGEEHLRRIVAEAQAIVAQALSSP